MTKCKLAAGRGFWTARPRYRVTVSAAPAPKGGKSAVTPAPNGGKPAVDSRSPPPSLSQYTFVLSGSGDDQCEALASLVYTMTLGEVALLTAPRSEIEGRLPEIEGRLPEGHPLGGHPKCRGESDATAATAAAAVATCSSSSCCAEPALGRTLEEASSASSAESVEAGAGLPPAGSAGDDGRVTLWVRLDGMTRIEAYYEDEDVLKETLNDSAEDIEWLERSFVEAKGEKPMLEEDVEVTLLAGAADGRGVQIFPHDNRRLSLRVGDLPLAEDWALLMLMTMYQGERAKVTARGAKAGYLVEALCAMRRDQGGCSVDATAAAAHVRGAAAGGLVLTLTILHHRPPDPRDGVSGARLLASAESLKTRANALFNAGYVSNAMRKYVRATWLMQDGDESEAPNAPMTQVVGIGKGGEPRRTRFNASQAAAVTALRLSLHLNLAAGALKLNELHGALAAAKVARELAPDSVKALYRQSCALAALHDFGSARDSLERVLQLDPNNGAARQLLERVRAGQASSLQAERRQFTGVFSRVHRGAAGGGPGGGPGGGHSKGEGGALYNGAELREMERRERERTRYVSDRAEERRRGVEMLDVAELSRLPEEVRQRELDKMNESLEAEQRLQHTVPEGLSAEAFKRLLQMRTDGVAEQTIEAEMARMRREEMEETRKFMTRPELERMSERQAALLRDRYKSDQVRAARERELLDEYAEIKKRVAHRVPLMKVETRRSEEAMREASEVLNDPNSDEHERARAVRRVLHDPFKDLDEYLTDGAAQSAPVSLYPPLA